MENEALIRVKGKPNTEYEGKEGTAVKTDWYNIFGKPITPQPRLVAVLWDGEPEKELVSLDGLDMIE